MRTFYHMQIVNSVRMTLGTIIRFETFYIVTVVCTTSLLLYTIACIYLDVSIQSQDTVGKSYAQQLRTPGLTSGNTSLEIVRTRPRTTTTSYPLTLYTPYVINNPDICTNVTSLKYLVIVHTATANFQRRRVMRNTWANKNLFRKLHTRIVFLLGLTQNRDTQTWIENESVVYGDIVQGNFLDSYKNLTHKGVLAFRWISEHCPQAEMIMKVDDDAFVNPFILLNTFLPSLNTHPRHIMCHYRKVGSSRILRTRGKWVVDDDVFKGYKDYPFPYCDGFLVLMSPDLVPALYKAATFTPFFWVDDVYLFGILPAMVGNVTYQDIFRSVSMSRERGYVCYTKKEACRYLAVNTAKDTDSEDMWFGLLKTISAEVRNETNMIGP